MQRDLTPKMDQGQPTVEDAVVNTIPRNANFATPSVFFATRKLGLTPLPFVEIWPFWGLFSKSISPTIVRSMKLKRS